MKLRDVMTKGVETVSADTPLRGVAEKMAELDVGAIPLQEDDKVVGIVTDRDIAIRGVAKGLDMDTEPARTVMTSEMWALEQDRDVSEAAQVMEQKKVRRLLILNEAGAVNGIISLADLATSTAGRAVAGEVVEEVSKPAEPHR
jgi:CBS domain-containing protein